MTTQTVVHLVDRLHLELKEAREKSRKMTKRRSKVILGPQSRCAGCHQLFSLDQVQFGTFSILTPSDSYCTGCRKSKPGFILYEDLVEAPLNIGDF